MSSDALAFLAVYGGDHPNPVMRALMIALTILGSGYTLLVLAPFALPRFRESAAVRALLLTLIASSIVVFTIKRIVGRTRPWQALGVHPLFQYPTDYSFPSGHAAGAFTFLGFLLWVSAGPDAPQAFKIARNLALVLAPLIALSRVYLGAHYPGDVSGAVPLGLGIGSVGGWFYRRRA